MTQMHDATNASKLSIAGSWRRQRITIPLFREMDRLTSTRETSPDANTTSARFCTMLR
jgi:hypothetical protein